MRKITFVFFAFMIICSATSAQTSKGDWLVGGTMSLNTTSGNGSFDLMPAAGYFFANGFTAGAQVLISYQKLDQDQTTSFGVGPFARYYFNLKSPDVKPFLHVDFSIASTRYKPAGYSAYSTTTTGYDFGGGVAYFINPNVALEGLAGYNHTKIENMDGNGGFFFRIGFQVHLLAHEVAKYH